MIQLKVDETALLILERLKLSVIVDQNLVVKASAEATIKGNTAVLETSNLEFALRIQKSSLNYKGSGNECSEMHQINSDNNFATVRSIITKDKGSKGAKNKAALC